MAINPPGISPLRLFSWGLLEGQCVTLAKQLLNRKVKPSHRLHPYRNSNILNSFVLCLNKIDELRGY